MGKPTGFLEYPRQAPSLRPVASRIRDHAELLEPIGAEVVRRQAARCMDCGVPFCHQACPLGNLIPDWNDAVYQNEWQRAWQALQATNDFPEFTGRVCPAPCEAACVLSIDNAPVTIKSVELSVVEQAFAAGAVVACPPAARTGKHVGIVGSGPAGLTAAAQLNRAGHLVTVYERADRIGGLLRYGIPDFKLEKTILDRRLALMQEEGIVFNSGVDVGRHVTSEALQARHDAILLAPGATRPRHLDVPGQDLAGVVSAMDYLRHQNRLVHSPRAPRDTLLWAEGRDVVIIGGGDTGADCLGTAHRQGARSVVQLEIHPQPPEVRAADNLWPEPPRTLRTSPAHEEGGQRRFSVATVGFSGDARGRVCEVRITPVSEAGVPAPPGGPGVSSLPCSLALLAIGFTGVEGDSGAAAFAVARTPRGNVACNADWMTDIPGVFAAGDAHRGQSLIVWAMAEGRSAARAIDTYLMGTSEIVAPL